MTAVEQTDLEKVTRDLKNAQGRPMTVEEQATLERLTQEQEQKPPGTLLEPAFVAQLIVDMQRFNPFYEAKGRVVNRILRSHGFDEKYTGETSEAADGKLTLAAFVADSPRVALTAEEKADLEKGRRDLRQAILEASNGAYDDIDIYEPVVGARPKDPKLRPHIKAHNQTIRRILRSHGFDGRYAGGTREDADHQLILTAFSFDRTGKASPFRRLFVYPFEAASRRLRGR